MIRRARLCLLCTLLLMLLCGCSGGQEIEDCLFVISMAVDPAEDGNLTVTVKALSGTREDAAPQERTQQGNGAEENGGEESSNASPGAENTEPGYVVLSATAQSCLSALDLLGATTPRTVNLSQLQEIVLARALAETDAAFFILREIYALFEANGAAVVVVTPDNAGDFIRRQYAMFGVRLSQYLQVLFEHFEELGTIPSGASLASVISAMQSSATDAAAVYAAQNDFGATLLLDADSVTDRLPGHLPRTSPARNEYLGSAVFSGQRMVGTLTGDETIMLRLLRGEATATSFVLDGAMMQAKTRARVKRSVTQENGAMTLGVQIAMHLALSAGEMTGTDAQLAARIEQSAVGVIQKLQAMGSDAAGFGEMAIRRFADIPAWEAYDWPTVYQGAQVRAAVKMKID
ncbi:MAG: hypothetical protein IKB82_06070 [Clostridia bacterium]|nr:hypothetical protein [Clostridia bacterium]